MSVKAKYQGVLNLGEQLGIKDGNVTEEGGILKVKGEAKTPYEKDLLWDKIKELGVKILPTSRRTSLLPIVPYTIDM